MTPRVTLLTDFGTADGYVAAMKGVLASMAPGAFLDDASHEVSRGDPLAAALALERYWRLYPPGTVHLVVVDPGVGTRRRALALEADERFVVAPDNGVVSRVVAEVHSWSAVEVAEEGGVPGIDPSSTFHGRDVFAPAAARLAAGRPLESLGGPLADPVLLPLPEPRRDGGEAEGEVIVADRFGNLVTNIPGSWVPPGADVEIAGRRVALLPSYGHTSPGALLAVVNSDGRVEVAVRDGSAAAVLGVGPGEPVGIR
ncbi:MAG TPA: SAM-dependent chlorinase/fluorinase, partial [Longimicrobiales bacterium]|nr:SAM-dependent chlorinase/fluorinase [Longimicrobiales bacterium]